MNKTYKIKSTKWLIGFWNFIFIALIIALIFSFGTSIKANTAFLWVYFIKPFNSVSNWVIDLSKGLSRSGETGQNSLNDLIKFSNIEAKLIELQAENEFLKSQLGLKDKINFVPLVAQIFNFDSFRFNDFVNIGLGSSHGVRENMNVVGPSEVLVGRIGQVSDKKSQLILLSDPLSKISARTDKASGIVIGRLNSNLLFDLIPKNQRLKPGDLVISSGLDGIYVAGLPIGRIKRVINLNSSIYQQAIIEPLVDYSQLNEVLVIE